MRVFAPSMQKFVLEKLVSLLFKARLLSRRVDIPLSSVSRLEGSSLVIRLDVISFASSLKKSLSSILTFLEV